MVKSINAIHAPYCVFPCLSSFEYVFLETCFLINDEKCVNCHGLASIDAYHVKNRVNYDLFGTGKYSVTSFLVKGAGSKIYKISYRILVNVINTDWIIDEIIPWSNIKDINSWMIIYNYLNSSENCKNKNLRSKIYIFEYLNISLLESFIICFQIENFHFLTRWNFEFLIFGIFYFLNSGILQLLNLWIFLQYLNLLNIRLLFYI